MADFTALKTAIQTYIKQNGNEEINGEKLQEILLSVVTTLGDSAINNLVTALNYEVAARQNADGTLQQSITNEATARGNADTALGGRIDDEATARANGDTALSNRLGSSITAENTAADQIGAEAEARAAADAALQELIDGITDNIENGYFYAGIATPSSTPATGKVFYLALTAGTYTNFGSTVVSQGINILKYNGSAWTLDAFIGIDDELAPGSNNLPKSGNVLENIIKNGSAFDLSAYNAVDGVLATYADLDAALAALNLLPAVYKQGGMSFRFVHTSDNKYVQYRLMSDSFNTTVSNWQGIDDEPTNGSENLVKSGGVYKGLDTNGIICINKLDGYDNTSTFTLSTAVAAVPSSMRYVAKGILYKGTDNKAHLAIFISPAYGSGWTDTDNWILFDKDYIDSINNNFNTANVKISNKYGVASTRGYINFDNTNGKIVLSQSLFFNSNGEYKSISAGTYDMDLSSTVINFCVLVVAYIDNSYQFAFRNIHTVLADDIVIAAVVKNTNTSVSLVVNCVVPYKIDGNDINTELEKIINLIGSKHNQTIATIAGSVYYNKLIFPKTIYSGTKLKIILSGADGTFNGGCQLKCDNDGFETTLIDINSSVEVTLDADITYVQVSRSAANVLLSGDVRLDIIVGDTQIQLFNLEKEIQYIEEEIAGSNEISIKASILEATWKCREQYLRDLYKYGNESEHWYGVEWQEESANNVIAINSTGDSDLHTSLPIQSKMKRCIVKDGVVQYYLDNNNSELKADGTASKLDGTDGNVMVEIPEFFYRFEEETVNDIRTIRLKISEQGLNGFQFSPKRYTSAYEVTVDRTVSKLVSVCTTIFTRTTEEVFTKLTNYVVGTELSRGTHKTALRLSFTSNAANYRGGTNDSTLDFATNPTDSDFARNQLGIPVANLNRTALRNLVNIDSCEFIHQYDTHRILWMLCMVEYKTKNIQNTELGMGATVYPNYNAYQSFFTPYGGISCLPCGITNSLGNKSGMVYYKMQNVPVDNEMTRGDVWMPVMSYRGVENYYGHIYKIADQINILSIGTGIYADGHDGDNNYQYCDVTYAFEKNPFLVNDKMDKSLGTYRFIADTQVISSILGGYYGHILPIDSKLTGYSTEYCDCVEIKDRDKVMYPAFNGRLVSAGLCGPNFIVGNNFADNGTPRPSDGTRLDMFI